MPETTPEPDVYVILDETHSFDIETSPTLKRLLAEPSPSDPAKVWHMSGAPLPWPRSAESAEALKRFAFCAHCGGSWPLGDPEGLRSHEAACALIPRHNEVQSER